MFCCSCSLREQYVGQAISFKQRFRIRKSDIKTKYCDRNNKLVYLKVQIIKQVFNN